MWNRIADDARAAKRAGDLARADSLYREAADAALQAGAPYEARADLHNAWADLTRRRGRIDDAVSIAREGVRLRRLQEPPSDGLLGNDLMFLAMALDDAGARAEALVAASEGLLLYERAYGPEHSETRYVASVCARLRRAVDGAGGPGRAK